jgi:hypothetical protein
LKPLSTCPPSPASSASQMLAQKINRTTDEPLHALSETAQARRWVLFWGHFLHGVAWQKPK